MQYIPDCFAEVWSHLRATDVPNTGLNVILYRPLAGSSQTEGWFGVEVPGEIPRSPSISRIETPSGRVVMTTHVGPYSSLPEAHQAIRAWCENNGHAIDGANWETYGHWTDDESQLRTDVFYLLQQ